MILSLKFACDTDLELKKWLFDQSILCYRPCQKYKLRWQCLFAKQLKIMLEGTTYAKNYAAQSIKAYFQSAFTLRTFFHQL